MNVSAVNAIDTSPRTYATEAFVAVSPNPSVANQQVNVTMQVNPSPTIAADGNATFWQNSTLTITKPDGNQETKGPFASDALGRMYLLYVPTLVGNYTFAFVFSGQTVQSPASGISNVGDIDKVDNVFLPSNSTATLEVLETLPTSSPTPSPSSSPAPTPSPYLPSPKLPTVYVSCRTAGSSTSLRVEISGNLTMDETGVAGAPIKLYYSTNRGASWSDLTTVNTDANGEFLASWTPAESGNYMVAATWTRSDETAWVSAWSLNFAVLPFGGQSSFSVFSNSTLSELFFDSANAELSFRVEGPSGTLGYVDVWIPFSLLSNISELKVYLDGNQLAYTSTSQGDLWLVSFIYYHSSHQVSVKMGVAQPAQVAAEQKPLEPWIIPGTALVVVIFAVAGVFIAFRKLLRKKRERAV
jgi:hypothetical protein